METTYTQACTQLAALCDYVTSTRETVLIHRRGSEDVALISAAELAGLMATAHELCSPSNAKRLLMALKRARSRKGWLQSPTSLRLEFGLEKTK